MITVIGPGNGHGARTFGKKGAESFAAEKRMEADRRQDSRDRARYRRVRIRRWLTSRFGR